MSTVFNKQTDDVSEARSPSFFWVIRKDLKGQLGEANPYHECGSTLHYTMPSDKDYLYLTCLSPEYGNSQFSKRRKSFFQRKYSYNDKPCYFKAMWKTSHFSWYVIGHYFAIFK
jgi:hypothetical protein